MNNVALDVWPGRTVSILLSISRTKRLLVVLVPWLLFSQMITHVWSGHCQSLQPSHHLLQPGPSLHCTAAWSLVNPPVSPSKPPGCPWCHNWLNHWWLGLCYTRPRWAPVTGVQPTSRLVGREGWCRPNCHVRERRRSRRGRTPLELNTTTTEHCQSVQQLRGSPATATTTSTSTTSTRSTTSLVERRREKTENHLTSSPFLPPVLGPLWPASVLRSGESTSTFGSGYKQYWWYTIHNLRNTF